MVSQPHHDYVCDQCRVYRPRAIRFVTRDMLLLAKQVDSVAVADA